ncbi:MAG: AAA family ATPase [Clostridia bacterium]|nr:AAA family ATPase [Clostridia bacterium]
MKRKRWMGPAAFAAAGAVLLLFLIFGKGDQSVILSYSDFWLLAETGQVESVTLTDGEYWQSVLTDGTAIRTPNPRAADGKERLLALDIAVKEQESVLPGWALGLIAIGAFILFSQSRGKGALGLKKYAAVQADERVPEITFQDVAASGETLQSLRDLAAFLKEPKRFADYGARAPKGVLLYGPPGTGKTLLARALAGEAKAPFFAMSGADFVQVYVGVGASRVRELFRKARKAGGGVIFIDEIDAIGKKRDSGNDEREQTLNALLTEMSGFSESDGIIVLAATNRLDTLDPALLREGRFDRRIEVGLPDQDQRLQILQVHARKKPLHADISLESWAGQTALFSGAQLEALLNEAAIRAARRGSGPIMEADLESAFCGVTVGEESPRMMTDAEKRVTAWHEAGHALITHCMLPDARLTRVTVIPSSRGAAGYSMSVQPDKLLHTRRDLIAMICAALGGRAAEELLLGRENVTTGAANDLKKAREIAAAMANDYAMGETGDPDKDESAILLDAMNRARTCLKEHRETLEKLARALLIKETLRENDLKELLAQ